MFDSCLRLSPNRRRLARPLCRANLRPARVYLRTEISGALYLASLPVRLRKPPSPRPSASALASRSGKGIYLRRCAHITPADKLASLSFCPRLSSCSSSSHPPALPISPGLTLLYFSCNLGEVLQGSSSNRPPPPPCHAHRLRFWGGVYASKDV